MSEVRIFVNALSAQRGGGQTYLRNLLRHAAGHSGARVSVACDPAHRTLFDLPGVSLVACDWAARSLVHRAAWHVFALPRLLRELGADVYFSPDGIPPPRLPAGCRFATAMRNMLPFTPGERRRFPPGYIRGRLWVLRHLQAAAFRRADLLICVSEFGRSVVDRVLPRRHGRTVVIHHGVDDGFRDAGQAAAPPPDLPDEYVLYVSILDVYKAQIEVVEAWSMMRQARRGGEKLVLVGPEYPPYGARLRRRIAALGLEDEIVLAGAVAHDDLAAYYRHAKACVFASSCENCPNILLEMLASGRPVFSSNRPPMPELAGDAAFYFDPYEPRQLAALLTDHLDSPDSLAGAARRARDRSMAYSWADTARRTWSSLAALAGDAA